MVALTGDDLTGTSARIRAKHADGNWGPWYDAETVESNGRTTAAAAHGPRGTEPVFVGTTTAVQIAVTRPPDAPVTTAPPDVGDNPDLGYVPRTPNSRWHRTFRRC